MTNLPIDAVLPELIATLSSHHSCILQAEPGAGKTTRVPLTLLEQPFLAHQKIIMLEPRRIAARGAAEFMARQLGESCGQTVGYRMRQESAVGANTRLEVVTEGVFIRMLLDDPSLEGVGMVIFDEFHERNLDSDLALSLCLQANELFREEQPCRLLVMSATLDTSSLQQFLQCPLVSSQGRSYPIEVVYLEKTVERREIVEAVVSGIHRALQEQDGSLLVFLAGQAEIVAVADRLAERYCDSDGVIVAPLYGQLAIEAQRKAIRPTPDGQRKIVLATNIAESSITIEGVTTVIDSGWARVAKFDPRNGMSRLHNQRISQASATQRAGRAGRTAPGCCYRLWTAQQQQQLLKQDAPEILHADMAPVAMQLLAWGCQGMDDLHWLDKPSSSAFAQAIDLLTRLGAIQNGQLTEHGQALSALPLHPRLAHMLLIGASWGAAHKAAQLAVLIEERDPLRNNGVDIESRLSWLRAGKGQAAKWQKSVAKLTRLVPDTLSNDDVSAGELLALAYPDRVAKLRRAGGGKYKLASGRGASLEASDPLFGRPYLVVAELGGHVGRRDDAIFLAAELAESAFSERLQANVTTRDEARLDEVSGRFEANRLQCWGELVLSSSPIKPIAPEMIKHALLGYVRNQGLNVLPWTEAAYQWCARAVFCQSFDVPDKWPSFDDRFLLATLDDWLSPYLEGKRHIHDFKQLDMLAMLKGRLSWEQQQWMDNFAPSHINVPTGRSIAIDYSSGSPVLAVKMQEMFGCSSTPAVAGERVKVTLHLLSPAQRPLAVTSDLTSFWNNAYQDVKKEFKGRYPKHYWPDDPLQAMPTQYTKARMNKGN